MRTKYSTLILATIAFFISSCAPSTEKVQLALEKTLTALPTLTPLATYTPFPTNTPYPTYTPEPTHLIIVTPTDTATPMYTATATQPPTPTPDPLFVNKDPGIYLVGKDIGAGIWRNNGTSDDCYWSITAKTGDILNNFFGQGGGTIYIPASAFQVELQSECGIWTYLGQ